MSGWCRNGTCAQPAPGLKISASAPCVGRGGGGRGGRERERRGFGGRCEGTGRGLVGWVSGRGARQARQATGNLRAGGRAAQTVGRARGSSAQPANSASRTDQTTGNPTKGRSQGPHALTHSNMSSAVQLSAGPRGGPPRRTVVSPRGGASVRSVRGGSRGGRERRAEGRARGNPSQRTQPQQQQCAHHHAAAGGVCFHRTRRIMWKGGCKRQPPPRAAAAAAEGVRGQPQAWGSGGLCQPGRWRFVLGATLRSHPSLSNVRHCAVCRKVQSCAHAPAVTSAAPAVSGGGGRRARPTAERVRQPHAKWLVVDGSQAIHSIHSYPRLCRLAWLGCAAISSGGQRRSSGAPPPRSASLSSWRSSAG